MADRCCARPSFFREFTLKGSGTVRQFVCSDLWKPCLNVLSEMAGHAIHVFGAFHIMKQLGDAIEVRAAEVKRLKADGYHPLSKHSRWRLFKRPENLTDKQTVTLSELLRYNLQSVPTCTAKTSSDSGHLNRQPGPASSWTSGAYG